MKNISWMTVLASGIVTIFVVVAVIASAKVYATGTDGKVAPGTAASGKLSIFGPKKA